MTTCDPAVRRLIVNADDLGQSAAVNAGIFDAIEFGIVTSTSLMVRWDQAPAAAAWCRERPEVSVGLHLDLGEWAFRGGTWHALYEVVDSGDAIAVRAELERQLGTFERLMNRAPTHLDSHQHVHMREPVRSAVLEAARALGVPARQLSDVQYCGEFYGQSGNGERQLGNITYASLLSVLDRIGPGVTELACHPGAAHIDDLVSMYLAERVIERDVLSDHRLGAELKSRGIELCTYATIQRAAV